MSLGNLQTVPYFFNFYTCYRCKTASRFDRGSACSCEKLTKYRSKKVLVNDIKFDSIAEARRYSKLMFLANQNIITDLVLQPKFKCLINNILCFTYIADFGFIYQREKIIEDVKGRQTKDFIIKKKVIEAMYGIIIHLT